MTSLSRRLFVGGAAASVAALLAPSADGARIYRPGDWKISAFNDLLHQKYEVKQVCDIVDIDEGSAFDHIVNVINGLHFGFGIPDHQIKIVAAIRGSATPMTFNDVIWEKYKIGEFTKVDDWKTNKPSTRNPFYPSDFGNPPKYLSQDPNDPKAFEEDSSIQALQTRGLQLFACHTAISALSAGLIRRMKLTEKKEDIVDEIQSNLLPNVIVVPTMVSVIPILQSKGHFSYIRM